MKRSTLTYLLIILLFIGFLSSTSCKRNSPNDPGMKPPAGYRIILSGTANPSIIYIPESSQTPIYSHITVTALNNDGTPVAGKPVIFQTPNCCNGVYFDNFQLSDTRTTNTNGIAEINLYVEHTSLMECQDYAYVTATLVDEGSLNNEFAQIYANVPIKIIPSNSQEGVICIGGFVLTPDNIPVSEVVLTTDSGFTTVSMEDGSYAFRAYSGWSGTIVPSLENYIFTPALITIPEDNPVTANVFTLNFRALTDPNATVNKLTTDIVNWEAPLQGGTQLINVYNISHEATIDYLLLPSASWIKVAPSSGTTPGSFTVTVARHTGDRPRSGKVRILATNTQSEEAIVNIMQLIDGVYPSLAVTPNDITAPASGNLKYTVSVYNPTTDDKLYWTLDSDATWLAITPTSGDTVHNAEFTVKVEGANPTSKDRVGKIYITANTGAVAVLKVRQLGS